ncbi:MAG: 16S rRNA processing protein RimM [Rhodospirillales bacterium]|nr:16S rRNA processing protein RimM [Rhodospirillales bacterium]
MSVQDQDQSPARRICLGTIATAHGVRGLVKILFHGDDPSLLDGTAYTSETKSDTLTITMKNSMGKYWLAEIGGVNDRDAALELRGTKLWIDRERLPEIDDEDEFYLDDLIGLAVRTADGKDAGKVIAVDNFGAGDLLEIKPLAGDAYYLPFTKDNVPGVNLDKGIVTISSAEGK